MTQRELHRLAGTEVFTVEVAKALARRGHEVAVYTQVVTDYGTRVYSDGAVICTRLDQVPFKPDIIHAQHHLPAVTALTYFSETPGVFMCHGTLPWAERPPLHPRIRRYVMMCEWMIKKMVAQHHLPPDRTTHIHNHVDMLRYTAIREIPDAPKRACLYGHSGYTTAEVDSLKDACEKLGMSLDFLGVKWGNTVTKPEQVLQDYDLVFAIGKCALEAISCGCAVIPIIPKQVGHLVTMDNVEEYLFTNFGPMMYTCSERMTERWLAGELAKYDAQEVRKVTDWVREHCSLEQTIDKLIAVYEAVLKEPRVAPHPEEAAPYLEMIWPRVEGWSYELKNCQSEKAQLAYQVKDLAQKNREQAASIRALESQGPKLVAAQQAIHEVQAELNRTQKALVKAQTEARQLKKEMSSIRQGWTQAEVYMKRRFLGRYWWNKIERFWPRL